MAADARPPSQSQTDTCALRFFFKPIFIKTLLVPFQKSSSIINAREKMKTATVRVGPADEHESFCAIDDQ